MYNKISNLYYALLKSRTICTADTNMRPIDLIPVFTSTGKAVILQNFLDLMKEHTHTHTHTSQILYNF